MAGNRRHGQQTFSAAPEVKESLMTPRLYPSSAGHPVQESRSPERLQAQHAGLDVPASVLPAAPRGASSKEDTGVIGLDGQLHRPWSVAGSGVLANPSGHGFTSLAARRVIAPASGGRIIVLKESGVTDRPLLALWRRQRSIVGMNRACRGSGAWQRRRNLSAGASAS